MIYINSNSEVINFPRTTILTANKIKFVNQTTKVEIISEVEDTATSRYLYRFDISSIIDQFEAGQYDYYILQDDAVIDRGIAQFDSFESNTTQYEQTNTYVQYNV